MLLSPAQNYQRYYELWDSAQFFIQNAEINRAEILYDAAFNNYKGFPDDLYTAAGNIYSIDKKKALNYLVMSKKYGASNKMVFKEFKAKGHELSKSEKKIICRSHNEHTISKKSIRRLRKIIIKDQMVRLFKPSKINKCDSINGEKIKSYIRLEDTVFLNRFYLGESNHQLLQVLLVHLGWKNLADSNFYYLVNIVEKGLLQRDFLELMLEREAIFDGTLFSFQNGIINSKKMANFKFPNVNLFSSTLGSFHLYTIKLNRQVVVPHNPYVGASEINTFRKYLLMPPLDLYYFINKNSLTFLDVDEFDNKLKK